MNAYAVEWLVLAVDASTKVVFLAAVAAVVLRVFRLRDSNLRHRVWAGVLAGMLLLPVLSRVVPALTLPFAFEMQWLLAGANPADEVAAPGETDVVAPVAAASLPTANEAASPPVEGQPATSFESPTWLPEVPPVAMQAATTHDALPATSELSVPSPLDEPTAEELVSVPK
jgi:hypothetical protein